jgi:hypothetical protein
MGQRSLDDDRLASLFEIFSRHWLVPGMEGYPKYLEHRQQ